MQQVDKRPAAGFISEDFEQKRTSGSTNGSLKANRLSVEVVIMIFFVFSFHILRRMTGYRIHIHDRIHNCISQTRDF